MDCAILVVAATDGQMPQTREHLLLAKQTGIQKIIVFVNKADLVDNDVLELVELEIRELLCAFGFDGDNVPVIYGSALLALQGDQSQYGEPSIQKLLDHMDTYVTVPERDYKSPFLLPIDNVFSVPNRGTVLVGTIARGILNKKADADLLGFGKFFRTTVTDVHIFNESVPSVSNEVGSCVRTKVTNYSFMQAKAGENVGVLVRGIKKTDVDRGMVLCATKSEVIGNHYDASVYMLAKSEGGRHRPIVSKYTQVLYSQTWSIPCRVDMRKFQRNNS